MNLVGYTTTALSRNDIIDTPTNKNVVDGAIVELKDYDGNLVTIYDDINGTNPETQKTCDTNGQCTFFAEAGDYVLEVNGQPQNITISVNITVVNDVSSQRIWGDRYKGELTADAGVTLADEFSVLLYDGNYYSYTGSDPFPVIVASGTVPTAPDYKNQIINDADNINLDTGETVQEETDRAQKRSKIQKPIQKYSTEELLSLVQTSGEPSVIIKSGASLAFAEFIAPATAYANIEVFFEFDYIYGTEGVDFTFNGTAMDDLDRANSNSISLVSAERVSGNTYKVTTSTGVATQNFAAWSIRALAGQSCELKLKSISVVESGVLTGVTDLSILAKRSEWTSSTSQHSSATTRQRISIPDGQGDVDNCDLCLVSNNGSGEFGKPPYDINYYLETLALQTHTTKNVKMQAGKYYPYRKQFYIRPTTDLNLIAVGGKVELMCGTEIPSSTWVTHQAGPTVYVRRAPYDPDRNHNANVRNNTQQPQVAAFVPEGKERSVLNYAFTPASSVAEVEAEAGKTYFDGTDLYFSFPETQTGFEDSCFVYVCEVDIGLSFPAPASPTNLSAFNVHITGCKDYNWRFRPSALGSKFISLHWCGAYASATNEGYSIDRINSELIHCSAHSNRFDDFNFHDGGTSLLIAPYTRSSGDDGISHHETCIGWVEDAVIKYPAAAFSIPAFGAQVVHKNCIGYAATSGTTSGKQYEGAWGVLSGIGQDAVSRDSYAEFNGCTNYDSPDSDYYIVSQNSELSDADINKAITDDGVLSVTESGTVTSYTVKN